MAGGLTRRALFDRLRGGPPELRPPWAIGERQFTEKCVSCGDCIEACLSGPLKRGRGNHPVVDFSKGHCTFCGACSDVCSAGCFESDRRSAPPWSLAARVSTACIEAKGVTCRLCEAICDASAIRFRPRLGGGSTVIIAETCTGCGACISACPTGALAVTDTRSEEIAA